MKSFIHKQGLNKTFLQCDDHMWRLGTRDLLYGIQFDGGSDWFCLNKQFINYVVYSQDEYLIRLKHFYKYALLPSEVCISFDHLMTSLYRFIQFKGIFSQCNFKFTVL